MVLIFPVDIVRIYVDVTHCYQYITYFYDHTQILPTTMCIQYHMLNIYVEHMITQDVSVIIMSSESE